MLILQRVGESGVNVLQLEGDHQGLPPLRSHAAGTLGVGIYCKLM